MKFLLDTHAAFWLAIGSKKLGKQAEKKLRSVKHGDVAISDVTLFELGMLERRRRISYDRTFLRSLAERLVVLPIDPEVASAAAAIALPQGDPFDRIIVATALHHGLTLITKDEHISESGLVSTIR